MRVRNYSRQSVYVTDDKICNLSADSGKFQKLVHLLRDNAAEVSYNHPGHILYVLRLYAVNAAGIDDFLDFGKVSLCHFFRRRKVFKKLLRNDVHTLVRALGGQPPHNEKPPGVTLVAELAFSRGILPFKYTDDLLRAFFFLGYSHFSSPFRANESSRASVLKYFFSIEESVETGKPITLKKSPSIRSTSSAPLA